VLPGAEVVLEGEELVEAGAHHHCDFQARQDGQLVVQPLSLQEGVALLLRSQLLLLRVLLHRVRQVGCRHEGALQVALRQQRFGDFDLTVVVAVDAFCQVFHERLDLPFGLDHEAELVDDVYIPPVLLLSSSTSRTYLSPGWMMSVFVSLVSVFLKLAV
jgi:hypothetical protein